MSTGIPFPDISPIIVSFELFGLTFALRWYAMGYVIGILLAWWLVSRMIRAPRLWTGEAPMTAAQLEELVSWIVAGVILGGRLGFVLIYQPGYYLSHPLDIVKIWEGGMSFHGGFLGVVLAVWLFARRRGLPAASLADIIAMSTTPAIFLVRIANFINAELWGRPTTLPWGVIFPGEAAQFCPGFPSPCARHPSQLYEAALEGLVLGAFLFHLAWRSGWLKRPGMLAGLFFLGYGLARFAVEFVRQADAQYITLDNPMGYILQLGPVGLSMGQFLSLPMILAGIGTIVWAWRRRA
jgi:phosphatidylglycerol:prolipoprotein diacylglycerol transferase